MTDLFNGTVTAYSIVHFAFALVAIATGASLFLVTKGTSSHRWLGRLYVISALITCIAGMGIYDLTGGININHIFSFLTSVLLVTAFGIAFFRLPKNRWVKYHSLTLSWSYVIVLAFGSSQIASHTPSITERFPFVIVPLMVAIIGGVLIKLLWAKPQLLLAESRKSA